MNINSWLSTAVDFMISLDVISLDVIGLDVIGLETSYAVSFSMTTDSPLVTRSENISVWRQIQ